MKTPTPNQRRFIVYVLTIGEDEQYILPTFERAESAVNRSLDDLWNDDESKKQIDFDFHLLRQIMTEDQINAIVWGDGTPDDASAKLISEAEEVLAHPQPTTQPAKGGGK